MTAQPDLRAEEIGRLLEGARDRRIRAQFLRNFRGWAEANRLDAEAVDMERQAAVLGDS